MNKVLFCLLMFFKLPEAFPQTVAFTDTTVVSYNDIYNNFKPYKQSYPYSGTYASDSAGNLSNIIAAYSQITFANMRQITTNPFVDISSINKRFYQLKGGGGLKGIYKINNLVNVSADTLKAKLVKSTNRFDIYKLPVDNMLCLVPNNFFQSNMPTMKEFYSRKSGGEFSNNMPNGLKKQELFPPERKPADY